MNRLGATTGHAPTTQIQCLQVLVAQAFDHLSVGEVRGVTYRPSVLVYRLQPNPRITGKRGRRQYDYRADVDQRPQNEADQAHVVIKRQPTNSHVTRAAIQPVRA